MLGILVIAQVVTYVGVDEIDRETATGVLRDLETATWARARGDEASAYGLGPVIGTTDEGVWPLVGCRPLSASERAQAQQLVVTWARPRIDTTQTAVDVNLTAGCWVGGEAVLAIDYWAATPNDFGVGLYDEVLVLREGKLRLVERLAAPDHTTGAFLDLTAAGDLDGDGKLDFVYMRPVRGTVREAVLVSGGKRVVLASDHVATCARAVMFRTRDARGIAALVSDELCGAPLGAGVDIAAWRLDRGKLVVDPASAHHLSAASQRAARTSGALAVISDPCRSTDAMLDDAIARLHAPAVVVQAVHVVERTRQLCN